MKIRARGKRSDREVKAGMTLLRLYLKSSHRTSLRNSLASRHTFKVILQSVFTQVQIIQGYAALHHGFGQQRKRQGGVKNANAFVVVDPELPCMEHGFQQTGSLCGVRDPQVN